MSVDFGGANQEATIGGLIFDAMHTQMVGLIGRVFANYVQRHRAEKWVLLTADPAGDYWTRRCPMPGGQNY